MGISGIAGFLTMFGMLLWPVGRAAFAVGRLRSRRSALMLGGLSLIVAIYTVDLLPNGIFSNLLYMLAGALFTLCASLPAHERRSAALALRRRRQLAAAEGG